MDQEKPLKAIRLSDMWVSPNEHYFGPASCHPHCGENQGDNAFFQEPYPNYIDVNHVTYMCHGNGHSGDPCAFDSMSRENSFPFRRESSFLWHPAPSVSRW